ncbi:MAG: transcriptional repressor [Candidatus Faecousia sp.]|nr:transcriptional repressor [Candidatus Faecousia sp.]
MEAAAKQFKKRNAILACLRQTRLHPSAEMVYEMLRPDFPDISLATVYRNLSRFRSEGLIQSLGTVDGIERFDADTHPHVHFICTGCGRVMDLPQLEPPLSLGQEAEASTGCHVESCQLTFSGLCGHCQTQ